MADGEANIRMDKIRLTALEEIAERFHPGDAIRAGLLDLAAAVRTLNGWPSRHHEVLETEHLNRVKQNFRTTAVQSENVLSWNATARPPDANLTEAGQLTHTLLQEHVALNRRYSDDLGALRRRCEEIEHTLHPAAPTCESAYEIRVG